MRTSILKTNFLLLALVAFLLAGCGAPRVDASSDSAFKDSLTRVRESLDSEKQEKFDESLKEVAFSDFSLAKADSLAEDLKQKLDGKTGDEIISAGDAAIAKRKEREREQALQEIKELQSEIEEVNKEREEAKKAREGLAKFAVTRSRFYFQEQRYLSRPLPVIALTMKNSTKKAVSRAYFEGVLASPGRSVPWLKDSFSYEIPGGIEPGEELSVDLQPNMYGDWAKAPQDRKDMVLTVTATRIDGADGEAIFDTASSEDYDKKIEELNERLQALEKVVQ